MTENCGKH